MEKVVNQPVIYLTNQVKNTLIFDTARNPEPSDYSAPNADNNGYFDPLEIDNRIASNSSLLFCFISL